jgi:branched-chain amino acid transport system permease protein
MGRVQGMTNTLPVFMEGSFMLGGVPLDYHRLFLVIIGLLLLVGLWAFTHFTKLGLALQGMAQDEQAALMLGIDSDLMAMLAMGFGAILAGVAAILILPLGNIVVESGYNVLIMSIAVCIVGGLGSWMGAFFAAFIIGFAQILTVIFIGSHFQMVVALMAIILTLIVKPSGLFGRQKKLEKGYNDHTTIRKKGSTAIKVRSDGLYALMSWREMTYLTCLDSSYCRHAVTPFFMPGVYWQRVFPVSAFMPSWP